MKKRDPIKQAQLQKRTTKRALYEKSRKLKQKTKTQDQTESK